MWLDLRNMTMKIGRGEESTIEPVNFRPDSHYAQQSA